MLIIERSSLAPSVLFPSTSGTTCWDGSPWKPWGHSLSQWSSSLKNLHSLESPWFPNGRWGDSSEPQGPLREVLSLGGWRPKYWPSSFPFYPPWLWPPSVSHQTTGRPVLPFLKWEWSVLILTFVIFSRYWWNWSTLLNSTLIWTKA
jgi:hypothetical protein